MILSLLLGVLLTLQQVTPSDNLLITKDGQTISVVNRNDYSVVELEIPIIDIKKYKQLLEGLDKKVFVAPKNARLDIHGNIIPEEVGFQINRQKFIEEFYSAIFRFEKEHLEIPMLLIYPKVDSELLANIRSIRIGRYITSFNSRNKDRTKNIQLAAQAINNHVVFPGETFSFNRVVGKRTTAKGYLRAPVIVRGEFSEDIGGGICQVSSTLYNAVDNAGLQIVQRFSHSRHVPYIPPGRDATVSWYGPDFVFKNKYNQPVLIQARTMGNLLIIKLYSSDVIEYLPRKVPNP